VPLTDTNFHQSLPHSVIAEPGIAWLAICRLDAGPRKEETGAPDAGLLHLNVDGPGRIRTCDRPVMSRLL
jgi:hypothetical protein